MIEYRLFAFANIAITIPVLWLLIKKFSDRVRTLIHVYFAFLTASSYFLLASYVGRVLGNIEGLRDRAQELLGLRELPPGMWVSEMRSPMWLLASFMTLFTLIVIFATLLWLYDIRKKQTVWDYSGMPRWQKYLTWFLVFYGLSYLHAFAFGAYFAMVGGVSIPIFMMYGLFNCPINTFFVALLAPLAPRVNKPLYISICIMALMGAFALQTMIGLSVNLDALAVGPVGVYGLIMLWKTRKKSA